MTTISTIELYNSLKINGTSALTPRRGYYLILEIKQGMIPNHQEEVKLARAYWKQFDDEEFTPDVEVKIQLKSFELNPFPGSAVKLKNAINNIIHVRNAYVDFESTTKKYVCNWNVIPYTKGDIGEEEVLAPEMIDADEEAMDQLTEAEESNLDIANADLDQMEYYDEWDNYEANIYLDIEENLMKKEQKHQQSN